MTPRQKDCLDEIKKYWADNGHAPSYEDIKERLGAKSKSSIAALVAKLEERGYIERMPNLARSIRPTDKSHAPSQDDQSDDAPPSPPKKTKPLKVPLPPPLPEPVSVVASEKDPWD